MLVFGLGAFAAAVVFMWSLLLPRSGATAVWGVWGLSIALFVIGTGFAVHDASWLTRQRSGFNVLRPGTINGSLPTLKGLVALLREEAGDTLLTERAQKVIELADRGGGAAEGLRASLRTRAAGKASSVGAVSRFIGSLLLLLAVIGTFAGMKTALPALSEAVRFPESTAASPPTSPTGEGIVRANIRDALSGVADAFGANFLALIGAFSLAVMSFGATVDRRRLLVDLDRVLDEDLLSVIASGTDAQAFERLVGNLRDGIHEIATVGEGLGDLRGAIANFQSTLGHAIESLETSLTGQFQQRLLSVHSDMARKVESVVVDVANISRAMAATSVAYEGLVQEITQRENELKTSASDIKVEAINLMKQTAETAGHFDRAATAVSEANAALVENLDALRTQAVVVENGLAAAHSIATSASNLSASAVQAADRVGGATAELSNVAIQIGEAVRALHADSAHAERAFSAAAAHLTTSVDAQAAVARELAEQAETSTDAQRGLHATVAALQTSILDELETLNATLSKSAARVPDSAPDSSLPDAIESLARAQASTVAELREVSRSIQASTALARPHDDNGHRQHPPDGESRTVEALRQILAEVRLTTTEMERVGTVLEGMAAHQLRATSRRSWISRLLTRQ
jgi:chromosome segregation ATPase